MSNDMQDLSVLEEEFNSEMKGYGSLSMKYAGNDEGVFEKLGYHIRPEDIEALYFEGIGTPRWESIKADDVNEQLKIYNESMDRIMADYPMISRIKDTDITVEYNVDEVPQLKAECESVPEKTSNEKAIRAVQKFVIACNKAIEKQSSLHFNPC